MQSFSSWVEWGQVVYTFDLDMPTRKIPGSVTYGEHGGQGVSPNHEIKQPGDIPLRKVMHCLAMWAAVPSCQTIHLSPVASFFADP
jgi:hypothetical protein